MFRSLMSLAAALLISCSAAAEAPSLSLVVHPGVDIDAPAEKIWPHIVDPSAWKAGAEIRLVSGEADQLGAKFEAVMNDTVLFTTTNVAVEPNRRRTIRLDGLDGTLMGFASWELSSSGNGTRVEYHVYSKLPLPPEAAEQSAEELAAQQQEYTQSNHARFKAELNHLKDLVEGNQ